MSDKLLHRFKVKQNENWPQAAEIYLDDKKIRAKAFSLDHVACEFAHLTLELDVETDIDYGEIDCEIISIKQEQLEHELKSDREILRHILQSLHDIENGSTYDAKKNVGHLRRYVGNYMRNSKLDMDLGEVSENETD